MAEIPGQLTFDGEGYIEIRDTAVCHCGDPVFINHDISPGFQRGMCEHCDAVRCDAYPGECGRFEDAS